jgi:catechol 2,3-dioxygenase-like lactoylglutathione lyase family enzyme
MRQSIGCICVLVGDYDEAIAFYTGALRFQLVENTDLGGGRRWVLLAPPGSKETRILLAQAKNDEERLSIGRQAGGRVFLFLHTDDFDRDYRDMRLRGVKFCEEPRKEAYGTVAVFEDHCGNKWDLLMPAVQRPGNHA